MNASIFLNQVTGLRWQYMEDLERSYYFCEVEGVYLEWDNGYTLTYEGVSSEQVSLWCEFLSWI